MVCTACYICLPELKFGWATLFRVFVRAAVPATHEAAGRWQHMKHGCTASGPAAASASRDELLSRCCVWRQAGRPKAITGFQTHTTPVLLSVGERAELASQKYLPLSSVLEGTIILRPNPNYIESHE